LVYGALTAVLAAVHASIVFCFQRVLHHIIGPQSSLAIVTSTIAIVALFAPLRNRIQNLIDRRFYRSKYDAEKTLAAFSNRLRSTRLNSSHVKISYAVFCLKKKSK